VDLLHRAAEAGFSSAMFDASKLPFADNVRATELAAEWAHEHVNPSVPPPAASLDPIAVSSAHTEFARAVPSQV